MKKKSTFRKTKMHSFQIYKFKSFSIAWNRNARNYIKVFKAETEVFKQCRSKSIRDKIVLTKTV